MKRRVLKARTARFVCHLALTRPAQGCQVNPERVLLGKNSPLRADKAHATEHAKVEEAKQVGCAPIRLKAEEPGFVRLAGRIGS